MLEVKGDSSFAQDFNRRKRIQELHDRKNSLLVKQDPDQAYIPAFAKLGDVGLD